MNQDDQPKLYLLLILLSLMALPTKTPLNIAEQADYLERIKIP